MTFWQNIDFFVGGAVRRPQNDWQKAIKSYLEHLYDQIRTYFERN